MPGDSYRSLDNGTGEAQEVEYLLFRFFDFSVEEGKQYRYRVQLVLENPNAGVQPKYLKEPKASSELTKYSPVSDPSPVASVSSGNGYLFAGPVKAADKSIDEPKANLIAVQLDPKMGTKAVYEIRNPNLKIDKNAKREMLPVTRGQLIKFSAKVDVVNPLTRIPKEETVAFDVNRTLVDIRGGERFSPGNLKDPDTVPGDVLLMDANGKLYAHSEAADEPDYVAEAAWLEQLRMAKESNSQAPLGTYPDDGGEGGVPFLRRGRGDGS
jgi:hypothetical protein